ncbi:O-antigen ligase family protein [Patescibacteria group bacterium]|nr:O-antigen ligase family protein [Patescibacteria group bacterium]
MTTKISNGAKIFSVILEIGWLAIFACSPIFFAPFIYGTWQISEYFLFQVLVEIILFVWLVKLILTTKQFNNLTRYFKFIFPALIFIFILGLAAVFSQSPHYSFWGYYSRKMGYLIWLHFFAFFLILFFNLKNKKQITRIFHIIVAATGIVVLYGFLQILGLDIFSWKESPFLGYRVFSTLGQPNFLASWLLLVIPVIFWALFIKTHKPFKQFFLRPVFICLFLLAIFVFILTQSRGGWIGFFFAFFFFVIIFAWLKKQKRLTTLLLVLLFLSLIFVVALNLYPFPLNKGDNILVRRFKTLSHLTEAGQLRFIWWQNSLDLIKQKPVLGYGLETQHLNFVRYYRPEFAALEAINQIPDRAHNDILDILLTSGLLGLVSYLFLIGSVFWLGLRHIFKPNPQAPKYPSTQVMVLVLLTGLTGYLISLQFSFHVIPTAIYFWAYLAIILNLTGPGPLLTGPNLTGPGPLNKPSKSRFNIGL